MPQAKDHLILGWREWISLPTLGISKIKAKIDTGARTSALHAFMIETFRESQRDKVRFHIHPRQRNISKIAVCTADIVDVRWVTDSGGHTEQRYVINTLMQIGPISENIEITLTNRDSMIFRMLLGRTALAARFLVDANHSYLMGK